MTAPNIVDVAAIKGESSVKTTLTTTQEFILMNWFDSNCVYKINSIVVTNIDGTNAADATVTIDRSDVSYAIVNTVTVPADASLVVLSKETSIYLEEGDGISASASADGDLNITISYEIITESASIPGPEIVTSGLQMSLDAGDSSSYPGSGTTWSDLSGNANDVTLSGTTYTADDGGGIVFGSGDVGSFGGGLNFANGGFTISVWLKHTGTVSTARIQRYFTLGSSPVEGPVLRHNSSSNDSLMGYLFDSGSTLQSVDVSGQVVSGNYYNFVYQYDGSVFRLYNNLVEVGTLSTSITLPSPGTGILSTTGGEYFEGNMYAVQYYNKALTRDERFQNYAYFRDRFGLTNG